MSYQDYINCSREALLEKMAELLPEKRLTHCLGVERAAMELAQRFGVDVEKASLAGLLHDYAKKLSDQEFLDLIDRYQLDPDLKNWGNNVWHGMVWSEFTKFRKIWICMIQKSCEPLKSIQSVLVK